MILTFNRTLLTFAYLAAFAFLVSCNNSGTTNSDSTTPKPGNTGVKADRQLIIKELGKLKAILASNDENKIAGVFNFPLSDSIQIYTDSEAFQKERQLNGDKVSRKLFLKYFQEISNDIQVEQVNELFKNINTTGLLQKDTLEYKNLISTEPCYSFYGIEIKNDRVTLSVGSGSNDDYKSEVAEDEIPENSSEFCDNVIWWIFKFENGKLQLVNINGAG